MARTLLIHGIMKQSGTSVQILAIKDVNKVVNHLNIGQSIKNCQRAGDIWEFTHRKSTYLLDPTAFAQISVLIVEDIKEIS